MANTTNFGWETPDDTDLVKDGALAMRTLGNAIDTSLVDLKGGTTGQVLSKNTNTDMDFTWVTPNDADAIQNSIVDAKGDLISATADNTPARLASSGVNGQVLTIDTSTATGLKWSAPAASSFVGCYAQANADTNISDLATTAIPMAKADIYDTNNFHSTTTNNTRITIPSGLGGYYQITANVRWNQNSSGRRALSIYVNGSEVEFRESMDPGGQTFPSLTATVVRNLAAGDYVEMFAFQSSGGTLAVRGAGSNDGTGLLVAYLGA